MTVPPDLPRKLASEALGSLLLVMAVIGSGIMAERLAGGSDAVALLANTGATVAALYVLITALAPIGGAHFNPAVSLAMAWRGQLPWTQLGPYITAQMLGMAAGVMLTHAMFDLPLLQIATKPRAGLPQMLAECIAAFGLLLIIWLVAAARPRALAASVALYIGAAYWFTASTSFANPAITLARALSDSFAGIRPGDAPGFIVAQLLGALAATWLAAWLAGRRPPAQR